MFRNSKFRPLLVDVLMLLPVIMLAVAAFHLVERDRMAMLQQVNSEADRLLKHVVDKIDWALNRNGLPDSLPPPEIVEFNGKRNLIIPPPFNPLPTPAPLDISRAQRDFAIDILTNFVTNAANAIAAFTRAEPSPHALTWFTYELAFSARSEIERGDLLRMTANTAPPNHLSEAGQPFYMLARIALIKSNLETNKWLDWCSDSIAQPSYLTPVLLDTVKQAFPGQEINFPQWETEQELRALWISDLKELRGTFFKGPAEFIIGQTYHWSGNNSWLIRFESHNRMLLWRENDVTNFVNSVADAAFASTEYFYPMIYLGKIAPINTGNNKGKVLIRGGKGGGTYWKNDLVDRIPRVVAENKTAQPDALKVQILLSSPEFLAARMQEREIGLALIVSACSIFSIIAVIFNRRAIRKEHRLNELKSNFISSVSHELRAPVAAVRLMAENLENGTVTHPLQQEEYYKLIHRECRRLSRLIGNLLDFARIEQNRREYSFEEVSLEELALDTLEMVKPLAEEAHVQLSYEGGPDLLATGDRDALQQALTNLLDNAIKHSAEGQQVRVGITDIPSIWVEDSGPGIPNEDQARIFERFYRRGNELRRKTEGVGIGLTIVKHIVEAHRGSILVESEPGKGTRFTINLQESSRVQTGGVHA